MSVLVSIVFSTYNNVAKEAVVRLSTGKAVLNILGLSIHSQCGSHIKLGASICRCRRFRTQETSQLHSVNLIFPCN